MSTPTTTPGMNLPASTEVISNTATVATAADKSLQSPASPASSLGGASAPRLTQPGSFQDAAQRPEGMTMLTPPSASTSANSAHLTDQAVLEYLKSKGMKRAVSELQAILKKQEASSSAMLTGTAPATTAVYKNGTVNDEKRRQQNREASRRYRQRQKKNKEAKKERKKELGRLRQRKYEAKKKEAEIPAIVETSDIVDTAAISYGSV